MLLLALVLAVAPQTQADMNASAAEELARADAAMNAQYRASMAVMRRKDGSPTPVPTRRNAPSRANALLQAQRAWLAYRDAECAAEASDFAGGSAYGMALASCKAELTRERTERLKPMASSDSR